MSLLDIYEELSKVTGDQFEVKRNEIMHTFLYSMALDDKGNLDRGRLDRLYFRQRGIDREMTKNPVVNARKLIDLALQEMCKLNHPIQEKAEVTQI